VFYYRITVTTTTDRAGVQNTRRATEYREFLRPEHLGEHIASLVAKRPRSITIHPVNQATYIRRTRAGE